METRAAATPRADLIRSRFPDSITSVTEDSAELRIEAVPSAVYDLCLFLRDEMGFDYPASLCGHDTGELFVVWYHVYNMDERIDGVVRVELPRENPELRSVISIWPGMNWHERETFDMYGIRFPGHPLMNDPTAMRILLPEDWDGFPFRKDYEPVFSGDPTHGPQETN